MRFPFPVVLLAIAVSGCASKPVPVAVAPTGAPVASPMPSPTVPLKLPTTAAEIAYISNASKARGLVPFKILKGRDGDGDAIGKELDRMGLQVAKARQLLSISKPSARLATGHATFESALDEMMDAIKAARSAIDARDADAFNRANLARIEATKRVNLASRQYGEALKQ